jgi:glucosamine-6-phosphate deaminase
MEILIKPSPENASEHGARMIAHLIREKPDAVLGLATGRTPVMLYKELIRLHREEDLDFSQVRTFNLDEYVGLQPDHVQSYRYFMEENLFRHINIKKENTHVPDGVAQSLRDECRDYEHRIVDAGGIDLQVLGLGSNGHIGFNEPTGSLSSRTWVKILSQQTVKDNSDLFDDPDEVPRHCLTMGVGSILDARRCIVLAFGHKKAKAVVNLVEGPVTAMCPASALQLHPRTTILIDENAAARLDNADHYHWIDQHKLSWQKYD